MTVMIMMIIIIIIIPDDRSFRCDRDVMSDVYYFFLAIHFFHP